MSHPIGIDLGTTNSVVAHVDHHGRPAILPNASGQPVTPSVVCFRDGEVLVGEEAKELQAAGEPEVAAYFKRAMGDPHFLFRAGGRDLTATDLSALVLEALGGAAASEIGEHVGSAVITVPAYFKNREREATIEAGRRAGLDVLQVVNEPTAAAVAYGYGRTGPTRTLLVYDLGGGTFDVTLLRIGDGAAKVLTSEGDHELGGKDWDDRIVELLADRFEKEHGIDPLADLESAGDLLVRAEEAKKRLSSRTSASISLVHAGRRGRYELDRASFEALTADLLERTASLCLRVLGEEELEPHEVDGVLLVGGSTRMPMVGDFVRRTFGDSLVAGINVDEAVALGAALVAAERRPEQRGRLSGAVAVADVTNHSLGMIALDETRSSYLNSLILPKNSPIPCTETRPYQFETRARVDNHLEVFMTQGESASPAEVDYLGLYVLHDVPRAADGPTLVDIEYRYDRSGTVQVSAAVRESGEPLRLSIEPLPSDVPDRFLRPPLEQVFEPVHVTAYLAFDLSGSMAGAPLREAKRAAESFLANVDLAHCSLGIIAFADRVETSLRACQNAREIERAVRRLEVGSVGTGNREDPFDRVHGLLANVEGPRFAVTLADGAWYDQERAVARARSCHRAGIESIAIGFGEADEAFLRRIASADEASFFTSMEGLVETFTHVAQVLTESGSALRAPESDQPAPAGDSARRSLLRRLVGG